LRSENYVAFFTICGFFIGMIFSMVKFDSAESFLFGTLTMTLFFYLFIHLVLIFFLSDKGVEESLLFNKKKYEDLANNQISEIKKREDEITALIKSINGQEPTEKKGV
jgi:glucan phosphoethanolaminetransferase (alkaline phosphatase superfamily)